MVRSIYLLEVFLFTLLLFACSSASKRESSPTGQLTGNAQNPKNATEQADDASFDTDDEADYTVSDPLEAFNRPMHSFNEFFIRYLINPTAEAWQFILPSFIRKGVQNFFSWAYTPGRLVNNLLQANFKGAGKETAQFIVNGTVGMLGFYDAANEIFEIEKGESNTDKTLRTWRIPEGPYVVWPFIGPHTLRGTLGFTGDIFLQPQAVLVPVYIKPKTLWVDFGIVAGTYTVRAVNDASFNPKAYDELVRDAIDSYSFIRDIYLQNIRKED